MDILLGFAPFVIFWLTTMVSVSLGVWLAFAVAFVVTIRDFVESPSLRQLDAANVLLFGLLAVITGFIIPNVTLPALRLAVEAPLFVLVLVSLARRQPLTLAYNPDLAKPFWRKRVVINANSLLTFTWGLAFLLMAMGDASVMADPSLPPLGDFALGFAALGLAVAFTLRYPARFEPVRRRLSRV